MAARGGGFQNPIRLPPIIPGLCLLVHSTNRYPSFPSPVLAPGNAGMISPAPPVWGGDPYPEGESLEKQCLGGNGDFPLGRLSTPTEPTRLFYFPSGYSCPSSSLPCSHLCWGMGGVNLRTFPEMRRGQDAKVFGSHSRGRPLRPSLSMKLCLWDCSGFARVPIY